MLRIFRKKWCRAPKWTSNKQILDEYYNHDRFSIKLVSFTSKKALAVFLNNGLHHKICVKTSCYQMTINSNSNCTHCSYPSIDVSHMIGCDAFLIHQLPIDKLKFDFSFYERDLNFNLHIILLQMVFLFSIPHLSISLMNYFLLFLLLLLLLLLLLFLLLFITLLRRESTSPCG